MNKAEITDINVNRFFKGYVWDFKTYPNEEVAKYFSNKKKTVVDVSDIKDTQLYYDIRDILVCCMVNGEPYPYKSKYFSILFLLPDFMATVGYENFLCLNDWEDVSKKWCDYLTRKGRKDLHGYHSTLIQCYYTILEFRDTRKGLDRNLWRLEDIKINNERINKAGDQIQLNFWNILNDETREYLKIYFKYLFGGTELAYSTIYNHFHRVSIFFNFFKEKSLLDITHDDVVKYRAEKNSSAGHNNHLMNSLVGIYKYLSAKELFNGICPVTKLDFAPNDRKHKYNTVPDEVIIETFRHLHTLSKDYLLIYLINVFTGIRISDICQLKTDCLNKNDTGYYLSHNVQKMQNVGSIPIAKELYELIQERISYANLHGCIYLFTASRDNTKPYDAAQYRKKMKKFVTGWDIKMPDGTPYNFVTHAFRHTIATTLYKMGMPSALIQLGILHHVEINMSRSYVDIDNESQLKLMEENRMFIPSEMKFEKESEADSVLPNGYCHMPPQIHCPNMSACLNCKFFRTSLKFLDVHEKHLAELNERIVYYKANGFKQNLNFAESEKEKLEVIITKLKEIEGDERYGTNFNKTN